MRLAQSASHLRGPGKQELSGARVSDFLAYWENEGDAYVRRGDYAWMAGLVPGRRVLEIGCGLGFGTAALVARGLAVLAIDTLPECLAASATRLGAAARAVTLIPADVAALYNEETQIATVVETMPVFVDRIIIVNDCSPDRTAEVVKELIAKDRAKGPRMRIDPYRVERTRWNEAELVLQEEDEREMAHYVPSEVVNDQPATDRVILINNLKNGGVGAGIARGYKWCKDHAIDCTAVMAGDGQMDPNELESICLPVIDEGIDNVKGNRLIHRSAWLVIPKVRFFGNSILSILTKLASGYYRHRHH